VLRAFDPHENEFVVLDHAFNVEDFFDEFKRFGDAARNWVEDHPASGDSRMNMGGVIASSMSIDLPPLPKSFAIPPYRFPDA
jgi:hypothetical protein